MLLYFLPLLEMGVNSLNTKPVFERSVYTVCGINGVGGRRLDTLATANGIYMYIYIFNYINLKQQIFKHE